MNQQSNTILGIIIVNVLFYVATYGIPGMEGAMMEIFALHFPQNDSFKVWQIVSCIFMHGGLMHILFNMYGVWAFGSPLENRWGRNRFLFFYFSAGIGASIIYTLVNFFYFNNYLGDASAAGLEGGDLQHFVETGKYAAEQVKGLSQDTLGGLYQIFNGTAVGASGAVYGILVAFAMAFPDSKLMLLFFPYPVAAKYFVPGLIFFDVAFGVSGVNSGIAHFAHVGGAFIGFIMAYTWRKN